MAQWTSKGRKLQQSLVPSTGWGDGDLLDVCSLLCRAATTYCRLQEAACNGYPEEAREEKLERHIAKLVGRLPLVDGKPIVAKFSGDPRDATVKLVMPDGRYDDWGQEGICVPGA